MIRLLFALFALIAAFFFGRYLLREHAHIREGRSISAAFDALNQENDTSIRPRAARYASLNFEERLVLQADLEDWLERADEAGRRAEAWRANRG